MAARTHPIHDYSFARDSERPRRQVWLRNDRDDDEVVLPRGGGTQITGVLVLSAFLASALVAGAAYAVYWAAPPQLSEGPAAAPLVKEWHPDPALSQANIVDAMQGPAAAAPAVNAPTISETTSDASQAAPAAARDDVILNDSAPGFQESLPQSPTPDVAAQPELTQPTLPEPILPRKEAPASPDSPYPNPTTTPPEMTQPPADSWPDLPKLDTGNPY